jgi:trimethylguanosine synthase
MSNENPFEPELEKYWKRRYDLFEKWDDGIAFDRDAIFSIKPEALAIEAIAMTKAPTVVDVMCGVGGIAIAAARLGRKVIASDISSSCVDMAKNNASIYRVDDFIRFTVQDFTATVESSLSNANEKMCFYFDPPWGGPSYYNLEKFLFENFSPDPTGCLKRVSEAGHEILIACPKNFDLNQIGLISKSFDSRVSQSHIGIMGINVHIE